MPLYAVADGPVSPQTELGGELVTYMSPVEAFVTAIKFFDWQKCA